MLEKQDIYNYGSRMDNVENSLSKVSQKNRDLILRFKTHLFLKNLSKPRILKYVCFMKSLAELIESKNVTGTKDLDCLTKQDIQNLVGIIQQRPYSPWTKHGYKIIIKQFIRWVKGCEDGEVPDEVKWIKGTVNRSETKLPGDGELITQEEVEKVLNSCDVLRDKAFITVLYESGCRIGELGSLRIGNILFDKYGVQISVIGKTGARRIRLVNSSFILRTFLETHPFKEDKDAPLWYNICRGYMKQTLSYNSLQRIIKRAFKNNPRT